MHINVDESLPPELVKRYPDPHTANYEEWLETPLEKDYSYDIDRGFADPSPDFIFIGHELRRLFLRMFKRNRA